MQRKTVKVHAVISVLLFFCVLNPADTNAASFEGVEFPDEITVNGTPLVLNGLGTRFATMMKVRVYVAALYLPEKMSDPEAIIRSGGIKHVIHRFQRSVSARQSADAWQEALKKTAKDYATLENRIPVLLDSMQDMKEGEAKENV